MRVAVIGAGAMGSLMALLLCDAGAQVVVYDSRQERISAVREEGIRVKGALNGEAFPETGMLGDTTAPFDLMVLAVSAEDGGRALRPLSPFVHRDTLYVSLQEGNAVSALAGLVGEEKAFAAVARVSAFETFSGEVEVEGFRSILLGGLLPGSEHAIEPLAKAVETVHAGKVLLTSDLEGEIWKRLEAAAAVSGICAISGVVPREARELDDLDGLCEEAAGECRRVAASGGRDLPAAASPWDDAVWSVTKPPMLRDIEAGRRTEVAHMSGYIFERARAAGGEAPVHSAALTLIGEMESGRHRPGEAAVKEFKRRIAEEKGMSLL
jgi:2-dehydropantoate 2-reductase